VKKGWESKRLGDVLLSTETAAPHKQPHTAFEYIDVSSISNASFEVTETQRLVGKDAPSRARRRVRTDDILFATIRPTLKRIAVIPPALDNAICSTGFIVLRASADLLPRLLFYYLQTDAFVSSMERLQKGTSYPAVMDNDVRGQLIPLPPLPEQRRIVAILDEAFEKIATAKANVDRNLRNAQELFESWLNNMFDVNRDRWRHVKFGEVTQLRRGHNPPKSQFVYSPRKGYVRFWQIRDGASDDKAVYVPDCPKLHKVEKSDILLVAYRHIGRCFRGVEGAFNVALCCVSNANHDILSSDFLYHMIPTKIVRGELLKHSERSLIPSMSVKHLAEIPIPLPPLEEQRRISKQIEALKKEAGETETIIKKKVTALDELKASLLHQAFTGQL
jgi:type I restriction enzyme S subunit